ncbi:MAG TPA: LytTR family DNA-binding domain-containing protein [Crocinitomicaceae bacterium]|nr:LytTR family DNA-binding domain-containing protein [Crocinitomicaceae bacterium]
MINCVIIEDEIAGQVLLQKKLEMFPECSVVKVLDTKKGAIDYLSKNDVDIVFLDIHLKGGSGIDVVQAVENRAFESVFITAHRDYAMEALNNNYASYYLLKPINTNEFEKAMDLVLQKVKKKRETPVLFVTHKGVSYGISVSDILYFQSDGPYTHIFTVDRQYLSSRNIGYFEGMVSSENFFRIHHSYLVNVARGKELIKTKGGSIIMDNNVELPVSQRRLGDFVNFIRQRKG